MISGMYSAEFISSRGAGGTGIAIFSSGTIHGGDTSFYYRGKFKLDEQNRISGTIEVIKHSNLFNSVFGPLERFKLILNGLVQNEGFTLLGQIDGEPTEAITIVLKKIDDLVDDLEVTRG